MYFSGKLTITSQTLPVLIIDKDLRYTLAVVRRSITETLLISAAQLVHNRWLWLSSERAPLISSAALVLTVCALSVTVAAISHILFILGASSHTFVLISKCRVSCSQPEGCLSDCWWMGSWV